MIASVVKYMTFPKTLGGIKWFKNQIVRVREVTNRTGALINWVGRHLHLVQSGQPSENFLEKAPEVKAAPETITELGIKALSEIVQVMDHELWKDAPLIGRSRKTGFYKANAIELNIDYNYEKQEKEINIYLGRQEFKNSVFVFELHMIFGAGRDWLPRSGWCDFFGGKTFTQFFNVLDRSYPHQALFKNS